jgi:glycosyltransferase involved in cell wall biosynthesis
LLLRALDRVPAPVYSQVELDRDDLLRVAARAREGWPDPGRPPRDTSRPLRVAWVCFAPQAGSGGHTTLFRMVAALERAGHECTLYLRVAHGWTVEQHHRTIRAFWPAMRAEIRDVAGGIEDADAIFATAWPTAYTVLASPARGARFYFVQDYEPDFYAAGSEALLAEATYGFGFHAVTAGRWLADRLRSEHGMAAAPFDFGCDLDSYRLLDRSGTGRTGISYYCRPSTPRRCHELAVMALDVFADRYPDVDIHIYGEPAGPLPFRTVQHGILAPAELNALYNKCAAGLVLSATNASLVPHEMLASGCIPVVNDAEHNRVVIENDHVRYAQPTPFALADALSEIVSRPVGEVAEGARRASDSV